MAASLLGRSGGHPINIVLLKEDTPDDVESKKDRKTESRNEKAENRREKEYNIIPYCLIPYSHKLTDQ